ncbi:hypothetical protein [Mycobacterium sp. SMC-2]|nr:hypothetical protein [Mycobacterium sp. SMC-2]
MTHQREDDDSADKRKTEDGAPVEPEAGEGPYPPVTGKPIPPIGN